MEERNDGLSSKIANAIIISGILVFISIIGLFIKGWKLHQKYWEDAESFKKEIKYAERIAISASNVHRYSGNLVNASDSKEITELRANVIKNEANLSNDISEIKTFKNVDSGIGDSLEALEKNYLGVNKHFLSIVDSGKKEEAKIFSHDVRRPVYEKFQVEQEKFFNALSENTTSLPKEETIWALNAYWFLLIIGLLPLSIFLIIVVYYIFRVIIGEIVGV